MNLSASIGVTAMWAALAYLRINADLPWTYIGWGLFVTALVLP